MATLPPWVDPSPVSLASFVVIVVFVAFAFLTLARNAGASTARVAAGLVGWLGVGGLLGHSGALAPGPMPPPLFLFFFATMGITVFVALGRLGRAIARTAPISALIGLQAFRLPLELILHRWYEEGIIPVQMTYSGSNFDIVTGIVSLVAGALLVRADNRRYARPVAWAANTVGFLLLLTVMGIAMTSAPGPLFRFPDGPPLVLPLHFPTVWIVDGCVAGALFFHLVTFRALLGGLDEAPE